VTDVTRPDRDLGKARAQPERRGMDYSDRDHCMNRETYRRGFNNGVEAGKLLAYEKMLRDVMSQIT
jgi:hypothetical protein